MCYDDLDVYTSIHDSSAGLPRSVDPSPDVLQNGSSICSNRWRDPAFGFGASTLLFCFTCACCLAFMSAGVLFAFVETSHVFHYPLSNCIYVSIKLYRS
ncbi:hypothetical protein CPC08DRAFT_539329 [Agrocybe pediades]|nr:hypothetical protein CPC08DRAFT_539329 [Agrocybe pediades]